MRMLSVCAGAVFTLVGGICPASSEERTDWGGFYIGTNLGVAWDQSKFDAINDVPLFPAFAVLPPSTLSFPAANGNLAATGGTATNVMGGGEFGFNWQSGPVIFGAEADFDGTKLEQDATARATPTGDSSAAHSLAHTVTAEYFARSNLTASLRARFGFVQDYFLLYATGGVAFARVRLDTTFVEENSSLIVSPGAVSILNTRDTAIHTGWTIGLGEEWAIDNSWSLGAEYRYSDFGTQTYDAGFAHPDFASSPRLSTKMNLTASQVTLRLNYRIGA